MNILFVIPFVLDDTRNLGAVGPDERWYGGVGSPLESRTLLGTSLAEA